jgi:hypothetical protein
MLQRKLTKGIDEMNKDDKISEPAEAKLALKLAVQQAVASINKDSNDINSKASYTLEDVQRVVKKLSKNMNPNYKRAIDRRKADEWGWRLERILRPLRRNYSADAYKDLAKSVYAMSEFERRYWIKQMELQHGHK